jgi:CelD/BcsL family acetyltransferase involved in cellulose biosynthesis
MLASHPAAPAVVTIVSSERELRAIAPAWRSLHARVPDSTPFQSPEWLLPWWRAFGGGPLRVVTLWRVDQLVAIAPCYIRRDTDGARVFTMVGAGNTDWLDLLAAPADRRSAAAVLLDHVWQQRHGWDRCELRRLPPESPLIDVTTPIGLRGDLLREEPCPVVLLPGSFEVVLQRTSTGFAANLAYGGRRAERSGGLTTELATTSTLENVLDALFALHAARWATRGERGVLADARVQAFHREAAAGLLARGMLRLLALRIGEDVAAVHYGFMSGDRAYSYISGYAPRFRAVCPGGLVIAEAVRRAIGEGATHFDFLAGREQYKYEWGAVDRPARCRNLYGAAEGEARA